MHHAQASWRTRSLWALGIAVVAGFAVLGAIDQRLYDSGGPGIVRFEFVADRATAARIMTSWGAAGQDAARLSVWLDFGFLLIYTAFLVVAVKATAAALASRGHDRLTWVGSWIWLAAPIAATFDVFENVGLLAILNGNTGRLAPVFASSCAVVKFAFLIDVVIFLIVAAAVILRGGEPTRGNRASPEQSAS